MALSDGDKVCEERRTYPVTICPQEIYRVVDDGNCILTTLDPVKALKALMKLIDKHDVTACWADVEILK